MHAEPLFVEKERGLRVRDYLVLLLFCAAVLGLSLLSPRELSMHEAVLPQSARTMFADGDWIVPKKGRFPWLEGQPLAQWITVMIAGLFGRCDELWIVRMGPVVMGTLTVLLVARMAAQWFGRTIGWMSGLTLATCYEFARYSWLAEDDLFSCFLVTATLALFAQIEVERASPQTLRAANDDESVRFLGARSWRVVGFFALLGLCNLSKGLFFGCVLALLPIAAFLASKRSWRTLRRYVWLWGWLVFLGISLAWPIAAYQRYPDVLELWSLDTFGRATGSFDAVSRPFWYYATALPWILAPWTLFLPAGLLASKQRAFRERASAERFLWCWALSVPLALSFVGWKSHHYLISAIPPWAILGALGIARAQDRPGRNRGAAQGWRAYLRSPLLFGAVGALLCIVQWNHKGSHHDDAVFLRQVRALVPPEIPLAVDMDVGEMRGFLCLFYLPEDAIALYDIHFLRDRAIRADIVYVVTQFRKRDALAEMGTYETLLQSERVGRSGDDYRLTLFRLTYAQDLPRASGDVYISPMQTMYRAPGPALTLE